MDARVEQKYHSSQSMPWQNEIWHLNWNVSASVNDLIFMFGATNKIKWISFSEYIYQDQWVWTVGVSINDLYFLYSHYDDVIMTMLASQITSLTVVYSIVYSGVNQRKHQSSASLAFVREIHRGPVNFPHKWPVTRNMFPFDDVIMRNGMIASVE